VCDTILIHCPPTCVLRSLGPIDFHIELITSVSAFVESQKCSAQKQSNHLMLDRLPQESRTQQGGELDRDFLMKCRRKFRNWLGAPTKRSPLLSCTESNPASVSPKPRKWWKHLSNTFILVMIDHKPGSRRQAGAGHCLDEKFFPDADSNPFLEYVFVHLGAFALRRAITFFSTFWM
jgi:hypothetical protein